VVAGHHAARRQHYAVIKSLTHHLQLFQLAIALLFVEFVLIVVKKMRDAVLLTDVPAPSDCAAKSLTSS
jgi:uncharacterized membrane protein